MSDDPTPLHRKHIWQFQAVRDLLVIAAIWGLLWLGNRLSLVTVPLLVGLGLAYALEPLMRRMVGWRPWLTRARAVAVMMGALVIGTVVLVLLVVPPAWSQAREAVMGIGRYAGTIAQLSQSESVPIWAKGHLSSLATLMGHQGEAKSTTSTAEAPPSPQAPPEALDPEQLMTRAEVAALISSEIGRRHVADSASKEGGIAVPTLLRAGGLIGALAMGAFDVGMVIFLTAFFFAVFASTWPAVLKMIHDCLPTSRRESILEMTRRMDRAVAGFIRGRCLIAGILCLVAGFGFSAVGVPYGLLIGLGTGILTLVPYLAGVGLVAAYGLLILSLVGPDPGPSFYLADDGAISWVWVLLLPGAIFAVIQVLDDWVLTPSIQGPATDLSTPAVIVAVIAGGSLGGVFGMLLAIPLAACLRIFVIHMLLPRLREWRDGHREDPLPFSE